MPRHKGLRHRWGRSAKSRCLREGCQWTRDRGYVPARYFHPDRFGGGETKAPVCDGVACCTYCTPALHCVDHCGKGLGEAVSRRPSAHLDRSVP